MAKATKERGARGAQAEAPAVITALHKQDRPATDDAMKPIMGKTAWRRLTPLQAVYAKSQLAGGSGRYLAQDRYNAGQRYAEIFDLAQSSGRDSTQALNVSRSSGGGTSLSQAQADAIKALVTVDSHMGARDRRIIRMVCGEGRWPSEAVRTVCGDYRHTIAARFREALDSLIDAFEASRRAPGVVNVARETHGQS